MSPNLHPIRRRKCSTIALLTGKYASGSTLGKRKLRGSAGFTSHQHNPALIVAQFNTFHPISFHFIPFQHDRRENYSSLLSHIRIVFLCQQPSTPVVGDDLLYSI